MTVTPVFPPGGFTLRLYNHSKVGSSNSMILRWLLAQEQQSLAHLTNLSPSKRHVRGKVKQRNRKLVLSHIRINRVTSSFRTHEQTGSHVRMRRVMSLYESLFESMSSIDNDNLKPRIVNTIVKCASRIVTLAFARLPISSSSSWRRHSQVCARLLTADNAGTLARSKSQPLTVSERARLMICRRLIMCVCVACVRYYHSVSCTKPELPRGDKSIL